MIRRLLSGCVLVLVLASLAVAAEPEASLTIILTPKQAQSWKLDGLFPALAVDSRGAVVVATRNNLFAFSGLRFLLQTPTAISDCAFTPDNTLLMISGRSLGYCAGGRFQVQLSLPESGMRLAVGLKRFYVFGGDRDTATAIYVIEPDRGHANLCVMPSPIGAASVAGDTITETLYFATANDIYQLVWGGGMNLICHLSGPAITSLAAASDSTAVYFIAGQTLYLWQGGKVAIISEGIGDVVRWQADALYVFNVEKQSLIKLTNIATIEAKP